jgi:hypothetical protein
MRPVRGVVAALVVVAAGFLAAAPQAAYAAGLPLEYSSDGVHWQAVPLASVYADGFVITPGHWASGTVYLRSTNPDPAAMTVVVRDVTSDDPQFAAALSLSSSSTLGPGLAATSFDNVPDCTAVAPRHVVANGQVVSVTLTTSLSSALDEQDATLAQAGFRLVVGMSDPAVTVGDAGCPSGGVIIAATPADPDDPGTDPASDGPGVVALTGSDLLYPSLVVAGAAIGVGWMLVMLGKRRRRSPAEG